MLERLSLASGQLGDRLGNGWPGTDIIVSDKGSYSAKQIGSKRSVICGIMHFGEIEDVLLKVGSKPVEMTGPC